MDNLSRKLDISNEQIGELEKEKGFGVEDIKDIQEARSKITEEIELSTHLKLSQKKNLIQRLDKEASSSDVAKVLDFRKTVNQEISTAMDEKYETKVMDHKDAFTLDDKRGLDTAKSFINEFKALTIEKKQEWLDKLDGEIEQRVTLRAKLREEMPELDDAQLRKLRRSEMQDLVDNVESAERFIKKNGKYFSPTEQKELKEKMADCSKSDQLKLLNEAEHSLHDRKELHQIFEHLPKEFIKTAGAFTEQALEEKERSIDRVKEEMKKAYKFKYAKACEAKYVSQRSADDAYDYFKNADMLGTYGMIESWNNLDKQLLDEQKLQTKFQKIMKDLVKHLTPEEINKHEHDFTMSTYSEKDKKILPDLEDLLQEKLKESTDETKRTESYNKELQDALNKGYISKNTMALSQKLWKNGKPEYKDETFDVNKKEVFAKKLQPYIDVFKDFEETMAKIKTGKLSPEKFIIDKTVDFKQSGLEKRGRIVMELHKIVDQSEKPEDEEEKKQSEKPEKAEASETEKKIAQLSAQAVQSERRKDYEKAHQCYQDILELDPEDQIAKRNADHLSKLINKDKPTSANDNNQTAKKNTVETLINDVEKQEDIQSQMEEKTILETFADETAGSETVGKSTKAVNRGNHQGEMERTVAEKIGKDGFQLQEDGTATKIVTINKDEKLTADKKAKLKKTAREEIIRSADPNYMQNIQFTDRNGKEVSANEAFTKIEQNDQAIKKTIEQRAMAKGLKNNIGSSKELQDMIDEQLEQKQRKVNLTT